MRPRWTPADAVVVAALLVFNLWSFQGRSDRTAVGVEVTGADFRQVVPLGSGTLRVPGPLGDTVVEVGPTSARVVSSPCPLQICVRSGSLERPGHVVACLPNRVAVRMVGGDDREGVDAVGR